MATRREIFNRLYQAAQPLYGDAEARQIAEMLIIAKGKISRNDLIIDPHKELIIEELDNIIEELRSWRPVQYIIGFADFYDMELEVGEGVLIPRPETEELVEWIASESRPEATILDVGTGSGCIAIALHMAIKESRVCAIDISSKALDIARRNGNKYAPEVQFVEGDALGEFDKLFGAKFDVVVSNPPYIPESDMELMRANVTKYEPETALFVPDSDPLLFYRAIAQTSKRLLKHEGKLYFEIYESFAKETIAMLETEGYSDIILREDFRGKPRMICATLR
ncbi:MAG: peptide chain release factor N(5)-glutamine methyltransferase [Alistipes sp.]|nr:peptide chain release factor N(5)-glutamine methyltransferase [Alistipes sp.]